MRKAIKFLAPLFAALLIAFNFCGCDDDDAALNPTEEFFVNDFADCINSQDEQTMLSEGIALYEKTGAQVVVVTVKTLGGKSIEEYSLALARRWEIGDKDEDNGVLLLLSTEDRDIRIEVGSKIEATLTDGKCGRILDTYGIPYLKKNDFSEGLKKVYHALISEAYIHEGIEPDNYDAAKIYKESDNDYELDDEKANVIAIIVVVIIIILYLLFGKRRPPFMFFGGPGGFFGGGGGFSSGGGFSGGGGGFSGGGSGRSF